MSDTSSAWKELARRASESKFSGITSESNDLLGEAELREGILSPNAAGAKTPDAGMGMMPPMMMGGMGAGRGGPAQAAPAGGGAAPSGPATAAAPGGSNGYAPRPGGELPTAKELKPDGGSAGAGEGLSGGGGGAPAPGGGSLPAGDEMPEPAGAPDADTEDEADDGTGAPEDDSAAPEEDVPEATLEQHPAPPSFDEVVGERDELEVQDGFVVEQERMQEIAQLWDELSDQYDQVSSRMPAPPSLGFVEDARMATDELGSFAERRSLEAAKQFLSMSHRMRASARAYQESEDEAVAAVGRQEQ